MTKTRQERGIEEVIDALNRYYLTDGNTSPFDLVNDSVGSKNPALENVWLGHFNDCLEQLIWYDKIQKNYEGNSFFENTDIPELKSISEKLGSLDVNIQGTPSFLA